MNAKTLAIILAAACSMAVAKQYRLKNTTTLDVIEDGKVVGKERLKKGTILEIPEAPNPSASAGKLISPAVYKLSPGPARLRASAELSDFYGPVMEKHKADYWSINCFALGEDWSNGTRMFGFVKKNSDAGKRLFALLESGKAESVILAVRPLPKELYPYEANDYFLIEGFEPKGQK